jgi:zinc transporter, ZIP family
MAAEIDAGTVGLLALLTALATGLGALPFLFLRSFSPRWVGLADAAAAGAMLAASTVLVWEGAGRGARLTLAGIFAGGVFVVVVRRLLRPERVHFGPLVGAPASRALLLIAVMTAHSVTEGVGVGVAFGGGETLGLFITAAIAVHNVPEGLAISLVLVPRGSGVLRAAWWSVASSLPQPLLAVPAFVFVEQSRSLLPAGLGFAAGAMAAMVAAQLIPEARETVSDGAVVTAAALSFAAMVAVQALLLAL